MPYYHVQIRDKNGQELAYEYDQTESLVKKMSNLYMKGRRFLVSGKPIDPFKIGKILIFKTPLRNSQILGARVWDVGTDVTRDFIGSPPTRSVEPKPLKKNVFIVHGRESKPVKELKSMLSEFGL